MPISEEIQWEEIVPETAPETPPKALEIAPKRKPRAKRTTPPPIEEAPEQAIEADVAEEEEEAAPPEAPPEAPPAPPPKRHGGGRKKSEATQDLREKVQCPVCNRWMSRHTARYGHQCPKRKELMARPKQHTAPLRQPSPPPSPLPTSPPRRQPSPEPPPQRTLVDVHHDRRTARAQAIVAPIRAFYYGVP